MPLDDLIRIRHMRDAASEALSFTAGKTRIALDSDRMLILAIIKELEIIGEAASKVSCETRERFAEIPWQDVVGMRNRLIHGYFDVDIDRVWDTVNIDLPELLIPICIQDDTMLYCCHGGAPWRDILLPLLKMCIEPSNCENKQPHFPSIARLYQ
jgi:uncharacterized protein with HEPN domain